MNQNGFSRKTTILIFKIGLGIISAYIGFFLSIFFFLITLQLWFWIFSSRPNKTKSIETTAVIANYYLPKSFELAYSRRKWVLSSDNICFVFSYPEGHYNVSNTKHNYINQNKNHKAKDFLLDFQREMSEGEGCENFFAKFENEDPTLFIEHDYHHEYGRGSKIFINQQDSLIMFEGYIYD